MIDQAKLTEEEIKQIQEQALEKLGSCQIPMNKDPAIERMIAVNELKKILCGKACDICKFYGQHPKCMPVYNAEKIVDAGWRRPSCSS